jgi:hypothetical protein
MLPKAKKLHQNQYLAGLWQLEGATRISLVSRELAAPNAVITLY